MSRQRRLYEARTPPRSSRHPAAHGASRASEEPTPSQLDRIAEVNARAKRQARGSRAASLALAGAAAALLGLVAWWGLQAFDAGVSAQASKPMAAAASNALTPPPRVAAEVLPAPAREAPQAATDEASAQVAAAAMAAPASAPVADRTRRARAKQEADARADAARQDEALAHARADAQERERREAEGARELAVQASLRAAEPARPRAQPAPEPKGDVKALCARSGGFFSEHSCATRECSKPEYRDDASCVRLREIEEAQLRGSQR